MTDQTDPSIYLKKKMDSTKVSDFTIQTIEVDDLYGISGREPSTMGFHGKGWGLNYRTWCILLEKEDQTPKLYEIIQDQSLDGRIFNIMRFYNS